MYDLIRKTNNVVYLSSIFIIKVTKQLKYYEISAVDRAKLSRKLQNFALPTAKISILLNPFDTFITNLGER